jgi:hypothetical protein
LHHRCRGGSAPSDIPAGPRALLTIEFADATGASHQAKAYSVSNCDEPSVGSEVAILDDQGDPGKVRLNSFENGYAFGIGMMGIAMLAFIMHSPTRAICDSLNEKRRTRTPTKLARLLGWNGSPL